MLSYQTVEPHTLELLKKLMAEPSLKDTRLVGALMSLSYFDDAEKQMMPKMLSKASWDEMKAYIIKEVEKIK